MYNRNRGFGLRLNSTLDLDPQDAVEGFGINRGDCGSSRIRTYKLRRGQIYNLPSQSPDSNRDTQYFHKKGEEINRH